MFVGLKINKNMSGLFLHVGDRWLAVHIRKLKVGRGLSTLSDGAVHRSSGRSVLFKNRSQQQSVQLFYRLPYLYLFFPPHRLDLMR